MIAAIVLAAGASTRMGRPKAALPLGRHGETVLSRGVAALLAGGIPRVVVVAGAHPEVVRDAMPAAGVQVTLVEHDGWRDGQLSSLLCGLEAAGGDALDALVVTLVDVPLVAPDTVARLLAAWHETGAPIVRPAQGALHGHPVLFDRRLFAELRAADPAHGAKPVVHAHAHEVLNLPIADEGAFLDLDTPEDYQRALKLVEQGPTSA